MNFRLGHSCLVLMVAALTSAYTMAESRAPSLSLFSDAPEGIIPEDGKFKCVIKLQSWDLKSQDYRLNLTLVDFEGRELSRDEVSLKIVGGRSVKKIPMEVSRYGSYRIKGQLYGASASEPLVSAKVDLVKLVAPPELTEQQRLDSSIGVNTHAMARFKMFERLGIHWARDYQWGRLGHGKYIPRGDKKEDLETTYNDARAAGVTILPVMRLAFRNEKEDGFDEPEVIRTAARRMADFYKFPFWHLENEYDARLRETKTNTVENWGSYIKAFDEGLKQSKNGGEVVLNGTSGIYLDETMAFLESEYEPYFGAISYHYYTGLVPPEIADENFNNHVAGSPDRYLSDELRLSNDAAHLYGKEAWFTETGYDAIYGPSVGEYLQALYLPRIYLMSRWAGTDKVFWFFERDVRKPRETKFDSCGLFRTDGSLRPNAATMVALSANTAAADVLGRVHFDTDDIWCIVLKKDSGSYVAAAWSVAEKQKLPDDFKSASTVQDVFGNILDEPNALGPSLQYFTFEKLPSGWAGKLQTRLLSTKMVNATPGNSALVRFDAPAGTKFEWKELAPGMIDEGWTLVDGEFHGKVGLAPDIGKGRRAFALVATAHDGSWSERHELTLAIREPLKVKAVPFQPGQPVTVSLSPNDGLAGKWHLKLEEGQARLSANTLSMSEGETVNLVVTPDDNSKGNIEISATHDNGASARIVLLPGVMEIPQVAFAGSDAPSPQKWTRDGGLLADKNFTRDAENNDPLQARFGWAPEGLYLAFVFSNEEMRSGDPKNFWKNDNIEVFIDSDVSLDGDWHEQTRQFFFVPKVESDGSLSLIPSQWKRSDAINASIFNDERIQTDLRKADESRYVAEIFIPANVLGLDRIRKGDELGAAVAVRQYIGPWRTRVDSTWPVGKEGTTGLLRGSKSWAVLRFES
ncbi:hypothetical protein [Rubellicoccus peritrichatus]|uniref:Carbohydrate-binding domain-containing protein n=1 Tax=Rubellicoccus peritrichatus TaxID=3080537 RepID=A0AAQ3L786_9BACT|nr:hypothetical protein [Puniceicoccus sp. CR14]WOO40326.1 hypothetical protein RZN69_17035 [Puniceicoccus sp. CR14]